MHELFDHLMLVGFSSFALAALVFAGALFFEDVWRAYSRKGRETSRHVVRFGGAFAMVAFLVSVFGDARLEVTTDVVWFLAGASALLLAGLLDDVRNVSWKWQLLLQAGVVSGVVFLGGTAVSDVPNFFGGRWELLGSWEWLGVALAIGWFLVIMNALNWIDGIDGLAPGMIAVAGAALGMLAIRADVMQPPVAIMSFVLAGSFLALWLFNMAPARIFLGTAGVYAAGFAIAYLSLVAGAKMATVFLVLSIPILDMARVVLRRIIEKRSLTSPDRNHIHHVLLRFGYSARSVSGTLLVLCIVCAGVTIVFETFGKLFAIFCIAIVFLIFSFFEYKKYVKEKNISNV